MMVRDFYETYKNDLKDIGQFPTKYIKTNGVIKLQEDQESLILGYTVELNHIKMRNLEQLYKDKKVTYLRISQSELTSYISKISSTKEVSCDGGFKENDLNRIANDAPIINLVNSIIIDGINSGASDIHIEGYKNRVDLRYRIDGVLSKGETINRTLFTAVSSRIKIMANLNIMERRLPQDGRITVYLEEKDVDLRVSIVPLSSGESLVLRLFIKKSKLFNLKELGYGGTILTRIKKSIKFPHGLILITGPTGSGKTTTLNAMLMELNNNQKKIITIEDPVEYFIEGVNQIQINSEIELGFSHILRRVLRQDPDVIMIGEIRDKESAELVVRAALTGHLVLSTLHTNDSVSAISRLKDLGIKDYLITSVLKGAFGQRLVRTKCSKCLGSGCNECRDSGFKGRVAISEGFLMDNKIEELILNSTKPYKIREYLKSLGERNLYQEGEELIKNNITTMEEIERVLTC